MHTLLLDEVYQGATESPPWRGFLQRLCALCRCQAVSFIVYSSRQDEPGMVCSYNADKRYEKRFLSRYFQDTPFRELPPRTPRRLDELVSRERLLASSYYRDLLQPAGTEYIIGVNIPAAAGELSLLTLSRTADQGNFGELERGLLEDLADHLCRALAVHARFRDLSRQREVFSDALDHLGIGALVLNVDGDYLGGNRSAQELLERRGFGCLDALRWEGLDDALRRRLRKLLARAAQAYARRDLSACELMSLPAFRGQPPLQMLIRPWLRGDGHHQDQRSPAICVFISEPGRIATPSAEMVRDLFGFSRAESAVASLLLAGKTAKEVAYELGISLSTVRTHIKAIFSKAGVCRQSELVASMLRSISMLA